MVDADILNLQHMCAFEMVKDPPSPTSTSTSTSTIPTSSPQPSCPPATPTPLTNDFCKLFDANAWEGYEYWNDISRYYNTTGPGASKGLGPVQGVGYVTELLSRLTRNPSYANKDRTQVDHTLDGSNSTFPLDRRLYADFSHDHQLIAIYGAMGLFTPSQPLVASDPNSRQGFIASKMVPFAGRMVVEKMTCLGQAEPLVRILVNDAVIQPPNCPNAWGALCPLSDFVVSQSYATGKGQTEWLGCQSHNP